MSALGVLRRIFLGAPPLRQDMVRAARRAPELLGESTGLVRDFLRQKQNADGGFQDRAGRSDLYYTVFGLEALLALRSPVSTEPLRSHLASFDDGDGLDFVHLCCLARCQAILRDMGCRDDAKRPPLSSALARRIERHRACDGGYHLVLDQLHGTAYAAFLALGAYQDLQIPLPRPGPLIDSLRLLARPDGGWANELPAKTAATNSTAAAMAVAGSLSRRVSYRGARQWLLDQAHPLGGFRASPVAPLPDLLSTATTLHALGGMGFPLGPMRERCLNFIDTLWSNEGGFHGHWNDDMLDVEYTFYGLLALGHLAD